MFDDYIKRTRGINIPIFLISDISKTSPKGAVVFLDGKMLKISRTLLPDILIFEIYDGNFE